MLEDNNEQLYIGSKIIKAVPMSLNDFKTFKGIIIEESVEDEPGYKVTYDDCYVSWSPKEVFERCYRVVSQSELKMINEI